MYEQIAYLQSMFDVNSSSATAAAGAAAAAAATAGAHLLSTKRGLRKKFFDPLSWLQVGEHDVAIVAILDLQDVRANRVSAKVLFTN